LQWKRQLDQSTELKISSWNSRDMNELNFSLAVQLVDSADASSLTEFLGRIAGIWMEAYGATSTENLLARVSESHFESGYRLEWEIGLDSQGRPARYKEVDHDRIKELWDEIV
jgi:hypothetical protein